MENKAGIMISEIAFANMPVLLKAADLDFFILDCEHGGFDYSQIAGMISVSRLAGISLIIRLAEIRLLLSHRKTRHFHYARAHFLRASGC